MKRKGRGGRCSGGGARGFDAAGFQTVEIVTVRAIDERQDLRDGLVEFARDRFIDRAERVEHAGDGFVFDDRHAVLGRERFDAARELILALGEDDRRLVNATLVFDVELLEVK